MEIIMRSGKVILLGTICILLAIACARLTGKTTSGEEGDEKWKLYTEKIKVLTPAQCGQCHLPIYDLIRKEGGKHRFECTNCHQEYHVYNPLKQNYAEIMPKCQRCHGLTHGETLAECSQCHIDSHSPKNIPMNTFLEDECITCHPKPGDEMNQFPSKHKDQGCSACHEKHAYIPSSCMNCHEPHIANLTQDKQCLVCHPVHSPARRLKYAKGTSNDICAGCHDEIAAALAANKSKHHNLACVDCHNEHKYVPKCKDCHKKQHSKKLLEKFENCLRCHIDPHNLPAETTTE